MVVGVEDIEKEKSILEMEMTQGSTNADWRSKRSLQAVNSVVESEIFESLIVSMREPTERLDNKLVWTVQDVARELCCSPRHVRKLVSDDKIPFSKIGRLVRFSPLRISEWLRKGGTR